MDLGRYRKLLSSSVQLENKARQSRSRENEASASRLARERNSAIVSHSMVNPVKMQRRTELSDKNENRALWESLHNFDVAFDGTKTVGRLDRINISKNRVGSQAGSHRIKVMNYNLPEEENLNTRKLIQKAQSSVD